MYACFSDVTAVSFKYIGGVFEGIGAVSQITVNFSGCVYTERERHVYTSTSESII